MATELAPICSPIDIIAASTQAQNAGQAEEFGGIIRRLYRYSLLKNMLDLAATLAKQGRLKFKLAPQKLFELDEGNCRTIEGNLLNRYLNRLQSQRHYVITIKKIQPDVIVHEMGHMLENEIVQTALGDFGQQMATDLCQRPRNLSLAMAVQQIMRNEVQVYPPTQHNGEWFARYFQLIASSKEIAGLNASYSFKVGDVYEFFAATSKWMLQYLAPGVGAKIDAAVAQASSAYIQDMEQMKHLWSEEKVRPIHKGGKALWSATVQSIKDNPMA